jgi:hypothetical protein
VNLRQLADKYSPWRARRREQGGLAVPADNHLDSDSSQLSNIEATIARGLFGWHPNTQCDGKVNSQGYCEKCGQEGLAEPSFREDSHAVEPLKFCKSMNSALRAIEKLWEMKAQVRVFVKTSDERALVPGTRATDYFLCTVKPPHQTPFDRPSHGSSATEAIARAVADFIDKESTLIRWYVKHLQGKELDDTREQIRKLRDLAENDRSSGGVVDLYSAQFMEAVRRFVVRLLDESDEHSLRGRITQLEGSLAWLHTSLEAQEPLTVSSETMRDYTEALDLNRAIREELQILEEALDFGPLDVIAGYPPHITKHPRWETSPEYLDQPVSLSALLEKRDSSKT